MPKLSLDERICIDCGKKGIVERKRCETCAKKYNRERAKEHRLKFGRHNYGIGTCPICDKPMILWRKTQTSHITCIPKTVENYNDVKRTSTGMTIARRMVLDLNLENLPNDWIVHHLDENPNNNVFENFLVMTRTAHTSLHRHLQYHRSLFLKENSSKSENCWKLLRDHLTTAWIEKSSAKVIRIGDIGQSASEPL